MFYKWETELTDAHEAFVSAVDASVKKNLTGSNLEAGVLQFLKDYNGAASSGRQVRRSQQTLQRLPQSEPELIREEVRRRTLIRGFVEKSMERLRRRSDRDAACRPSS